jgi:hypothetical protein
MRLVGGCVQLEPGDKIFPIVERGEAICTLHSILVDLYARFPDNNVLSKCIIDITLGTEKVFKYRNGPESDSEPEVVSLKTKLRQTSPVPCHLRPSLARLRLIPKRILI